MHTITINESTGHEFGRELGRVCRAERGRRNVMKIQSQKQRKPNEIGKMRE